MLSSHAIATSIAEVSQTGPGQSDAKVAGASATSSIRLSHTVLVRSVEGAPRTAMHPVLHQHDLVHALQGQRPVRDEQNGTIPAGCQDGVHEQPFGWLVEQQDRRRLEQGPRRSSVSERQLYEQEVVHGHCRKLPARQVDKGVIDHVGLL
jgi:hypothetical protein